MPKMLNSKKSQIFSICMVLITLFALTSALIIISKERSGFKREIGDKQAALFESYSKVDKYLFQIDSALRFASYSAVYDLFDEGIDAGCGKEDKYAILYKDKKQCDIKKQDIEKSVKEKAAAEFKLLHSQIPKEMLFKTPESEVYEINLLKLNPVTIKASATSNIIVAKEDSKTTTKFPKLKKADSYFSGSSDKEEGQVKASIEGTGETKPATATSLNYKFLYSYPNPSSEESIDFNLERYYDVGSKILSETKNVEECISKGESPTTCFTKNIQDKLFSSNEYEWSLNCGSETSILSHLAYSIQSCYDSDDSDCLCSFTPPKIALSGANKDYKIELRSGDKSKLTIKIDNNQKELQLTGPYYVDKEENKDTLNIFDSNLYLSYDDNGNLIVLKAEWRKTGKYIEAVDRNAVPFNNLQMYKYPKPRINFIDTRYYGVYLSKPVCNTKSKSSFNICVKDVSQKIMHYNEITKKLEFINPTYKFALDFSS